MIKLLEHIKTCDIHGEDMAPTVKTRRPTPTIIAVWSTVRRHTVTAALNRVVCSWITVVVPTGAAIVARPVIIGCLVMQ